MPDPVPGSQAATVLRMPLRPYPGLRPFEDYEAGIFFGREHHRNRLLEILQHERFLAVVGPSGSGKSSLVRAGLLPVLPLGAIGTGPDWHVATMRPGNKPLRNLAAELLKLPMLRLGLRGGLPGRGDDAGAVGAAETTRVETALRRGPHSLLDLVVTAKTHAGCSDHNVLVLVDQFEELFTYAEAGDRQADESDAFVNLLLAARESHEARLFVAITMRTDFLGHCVRFLDLPDALNRAQYLTPRLSRDEIRDAISQPAWSFGGNIDAPLVEELINAVQENADQLPVLQHALARMWQLAEQRSPKAPCIVGDDLTEVGGVNGALSKHGEQLLGKLDATQRLHAEWLFRAITAERSVDGGGQRVRRPQTLARIAQWSGHDWAVFVPLIERFSMADVNFVTYHGAPEKPADGPETVIDLAHESLMRQWATLEQWVSQESSTAGEYRRLGERMENNEKRGGSLLTGGDLLRALEWERRGLQLGAEDGKSGSGEPNEEWALRYDGNESKRLASVKQFIQRSGKREKITKYTQRGLTVAVVLASVGMAGLGIAAYRDGLQNQAASLWADIRVRSVNEPLSSAAVAKMHDVSRAATQVRHRFARAGVEQPYLLPSLFAGSGLVLRGAVGLDDQLRADLAQQLRKATVSDGERNRAVDTVVLGLLGESTFGDWKAAFMTTADSQQGSQLAAHFGTTLSGLPSAQRQQWIEQLSLLASDSAIEADNLHAVATAINNALKQMPTVAVGQTTLVLHELLKRLNDDEQQAGVAQDIGMLAKRLQPAELDKLAAQWLHDATTTQNSQLMRALGIEARTVAGNVPGTLLSTWARTMLQAAVQTRNERLWSAMTGVGSRLKNEPQITAMLLQKALSADLASWQVNSRWINQLLDAAADTNSEQAFELAVRVGRLDTGGGRLLRRLGAIADPVLVHDWQARLRQERQGARGAERDRLAIFVNELDRGLALKEPSAAAEKTAALPVLPVRLAIRGILGTIDPTELDPLGHQLAAAVARLTPIQAHSVFTSLLTQIKSTNDSDQLAALGKGFGAAAERVEPSALKQLIGQALDTMTQAPDSAQAEVIAQVLQQAVVRQPIADATELAQRLLATLLKPPDPSEQGTPTAQVDRASRLVQEKAAYTRDLLQAVSRRVAQDPPALAAWTETLHSRRIQAKELKRTEVVDVSLAATEPQQPREQVALVFDVLLESLSTARGALRVTKGFPLGGERSPIEEDEEEEGIAIVEPDGKRQDSVLLTLLRLAPRLDDAAAVDRVKQVAQLHLSSPAVKRMLLQALATDRNETVVISMQEVMLAAIASEKHPRDQNAIARAFTAVSSKLSAAERLRTAADLARRLLVLKDGDGVQAKMLGELLSSVVGQMAAANDAARPDSVLARMLVESCKSPYVDRNKVAAAIRRAEPRAPEENQGLWAFVRWAVKHYDIAVDKPPTLPAT